MNITLSNKKSELHLLIEGNSITIENDTGNIVLDTADLFHSAFILNSVSGKWFIILRKPNRQYEVDKNTFDSIVSVYGGDELVNSEIQATIKDGVLLPLIMFAIGISPYFTMGALRIPDYMIILGAIGHFTLSMMAKRDKRIGYLRLLALFNLYYIVFWIVIGFETGGWIMPGIMMAMCYFFYAVGNVRSKFLISLRQIPKRLA